jgi:polyphenol oxidase
MIAGRNHPRSYYFLFPPRGCYNNPIMEYVEENGVGYFRSEKLRELGIINGFTTRNISGFDSPSFTSKPGEIPQSVLSTFSERLNLNDCHFVFQEQVHGDKITVLGKDELSDGLFTVIPQNDALITSISNVCLISLSADCMSLMLAHPQSGTIANAHVGRKGAILGLPAKLTIRLSIEFSIPPSEIIALMGTTISGSCYEVGKDVVDELKEKDPTGLGFLILRSGKRFFDHRGYVGSQLTSYGILPENIDSQPFCSHCYPELFYSYRRDSGITGRQAGFIVVKRA